MVEREVAEALYGSACGSKLGESVRKPGHAGVPSSYDQEFWIKRGEVFVRVVVSCFDDHPDDLNL